MKLTAQLWKAAMAHELPHGFGPKVDPSSQLSSAVNFFIVSNGDRSVRIYSDCIVPALGARNYILVSNVFTRLLKSLCVFYFTCV